MNQEPHLEKYLEMFRAERATTIFIEGIKSSTTISERLQMVRNLSKVVGPAKAESFMKELGYELPFYFHDLPEKEPDPTPVSTLAAFELSKLIHRLEEIEKQLETTLPAHVDALSMFSEVYYVQMFDGVAYLPLNQLRDEIKDRVYQFMEEIATAKNLWFWMRNEAAQNSTEQVFIRAHRYALKIRVMISHLKLSLFEVSI